MFCECVGWHSYEKNHNSIMFVWGLFCILRIALKPDRKYVVRLISKTAISSSGKSASFRSWLRGVRVPDGGPLSVFCVVSSAGQSNCLLSNRSVVRIQYNAPYSFFQIPSGRALYWNIPGSGYCWKYYMFVKNKSSVKYWLSVCYTV